MTRLSRRHTIAGMSALTAAATFKPRPAKATEPVTVWWTQGYYEAENQAVTDAMKAWEKTSGTKVNLTIMNGPDLISKMIAAMQVGDVPDLVHASPATASWSPEPRGMTSWSTCPTSSTRRRTSFTRPRWTVPAFTTRR
jgi:ABC-type glycerol-3-phosphate transport system substrate-binding protein